MRLLLFVAGMLILLAGEVMKIYYIMPFPGSQQDETINLAYFVHNNLWWIRLLAIAMIAYPAFQFIKSKNVWVRYPTIVVISFWMFIFYNVQFRFLADKIFVQPKHKILATVAENKVNGKDLVIGVTLNGESKAYPIEIIGYHHQVRDTVGGEPVMVTYCTVCRTGRIFKPEVDGKPEDFRLVGMDHFNAMFEDSRTRSWWRQVNGEAIVGEKKGAFLPEVPSEQMALSAWIALHPSTKVLQPDSTYKDRYEGLKLYDEGKEKGSLERRDSLSWERKSWVVGLQVGNHAKAYDWIELEKSHVINDTVGSTAVLLALETDSVSFHAWRRPDTLLFAMDTVANNLKDINTGSVWNWEGHCISGKLQGASLGPQQSYQEYWHSWQTFRPNTTRFE